MIDVNSRIDALIKADKAEAARVAREAADQLAGPDPDIAALRAMVRELADMLEAEIKTRYPDMIPKTQLEWARYDRDMEPVLRARAMLK